MYLHLHNFHASFLAVAHLSYDLTSKVQLFFSQGLSAWEGILHQLGEQIKNIFGDTKGREILQEHLLAKAQIKHPPLRSYLMYSTVSLLFKKWFLHNRSVWPTHAPSCIPSITYLNIILSMVSWTSLLIPTTLKTEGQVENEWKTWYSIFCIKMEARISNDSQVPYRPPCRLKMGFT